MASKYLARLVTYEGMARRDRGKASLRMAPRLSDGKRHTVRVTGTQERQEQEQARRERVRAALAAMAESSGSWADKD